METLFGVSERRARQLMSGLPGLRIGNAGAVEKQALAASLLRMANGEPAKREFQRRSRVAEHLREAQRVHAARLVLLPVDRQPEFLPAGIHLKVGELRVEFQTATDLAARLYALGQAMASDWPGFESLIQSM